MKTLTPSPATTEFTPQAGTWVHLRDPLSPLSYDQALLLCEAASDTWVAWVPDLGETLLRRSHFFGIR
jgi:hypothetical protein